MVKRRTARNNARLNKSSTHGNSIDEGLASLQAAADAGRADYEERHGPEELRNLYEQIVPTPDPADIDSWIEQTRDEIASSPDNLSWDYFIEDMRNHLGVPPDVQSAEPNREPLANEADTSETNPAAPTETPAFDPNRWSLNELAIGLADNPGQLSALSAFIDEDQKTHKASGRAWSLADAMERAKAETQFGLPDLPGDALLAIRQKATSLQSQRGRQGGRHKEGESTQGQQESEKPAIDTGELFDGVRVDRMGELLYHIDTEKIRDVFNDKGEKLSWKEKQQQRLNVLVEFGMLSSEKAKELAADLSSVDAAFSQAYKEWNAYKASLNQPKEKGAVGSAEEDEAQQDDSTENTHSAVSNRQIADELADILDGKLTVDKADKVRYGMGVRALGRNGLVQNSGGQFVSPQQLEVIAANADLIRNNLAHRDGEPEPSAPEGEGSEPTPETSVEAEPQSVAGPPDSPDSPPEEPPVEPTPEVTPPSPDTIEQRPLVLSFVDETHDALAAARDAAEARLRNEIQEGGRFKRFMKSLWKGEHGFARAYYREKYKQEALEQIQQQNDVLAQETGDMDARTRAQLATIERFQSEYEESIHEAAGEKRNEVGHTTEFAQKTKQLIARYVNGEISDVAALDEERGRLLQALQDTGNEHLIGEGKVRIDNLVAIADQVKAMVDQGESLERVLEGMKIYSGEARSNVRTEAQLTKTEKVIDWLQRRKIVGGLVGPVGLGVAAAVVVGVTKVGRGSVVAATGATAVPGLAAGIFAGYREKTRMKEERALHAREMAQGKRYNEGDKRREEMEQTRYETENAAEVTATLNELLSGNEAPTREAVQDAYVTIALIEARIRKSDKDSIDFLAYSDVASVEEERRDLDVARAMAKIRLKDHLGELSEGFRTRFGIDDHKTVNQSLEQYIAEMDKLVDASVESKDKAYNKLRNRRVAQAAAVGVVGGFVAGLAAQEVVAFANPSYDGLAEHMLHGGAPSADGRQTVLESWFHGQPGEHIVPSDKYVPHTLGGHKNVLELPDNYKVIQNQNGSFGVEAPNGTRVADELRLDKRGNLTKDSLATLEAQKISVADTGHYKMLASDKPERVSVKEYLKHHKSDVTHVKRDFWYDNNTSKPRFEKNELGLSWGGEGNKGVGSNGSVRMTVAGMTSGGSYHGPEHVSWREAAKDGDLQLAVSASRGTQSDVFMVKVKPDGSIDIPTDHPARKFFTIDKNGQVHFKGAYAEVVEVRGSKGGVTHIAPLATVTGENSTKYVEEVVKHKVWMPHAKLTPPAIETVGREVEGNGVSVWTPRRPLERLAATRQRERGYDSYANGYDSEGRPIHDTVSPRLEADPGRQLELGEELHWFADELKRREGPEYVKKIKDAINSSPELRSLSSELKTITTIPVAAANESENIFKTLSLYAQQDPDQLRHNMILLNVNWLDVAKADPGKRAKIQKTLDEIERARQAFPSLSIAVVTNEYNEAKVKRTGGVIGYVASDLLNTALLALEDKVSSGELAADADVAIVRQDADMRGISRHYLQKLENSMDANPGVDIFHGTIRSDVPMQDRYPGLGIVTNFSQAMSVMNAAANRPWTVGINAVVRASSMAAVGGLGRLTHTGPGSDDVNIAWRISGARRGKPGGYPDDGSYYQSNAIPDVKDHRIVIPVAGMTVDSAADRLLPQYLMGRHFGAAWNSDASRGTSFADGPGGYRDRTADASILNKIKREKVDNGLYERIETNFSGELQHANEDVARRVLSTFFASVPNAYIITGNIGDGSAKFKFTSVGRKFIKDRIERESNGSRNAGSAYGRRKMRQLYGRQYRGGRKPVSAESPLVAPAK